MADNPLDYAAPDTPADGSLAGAVAPAFLCPALPSFVTVQVFATARGGFRIGPGVAGVGRILATAVAQWSIVAIGAWLGVQSIATASDRVVPLGVAVTLGTLLAAGTAIVAVRTRDRAREVVDFLVFESGTLTLPATGDVIRLDDVLLVELLTHGFNFGDARGELRLVARDGATFGVVRFNSAWLAGQVARRLGLPLREVRVDGTGRLAIWETAAPGGQRTRL